MQSFTIQGARKTLFGMGTISRLPEEVKKFKAERVLVVTDQGLSATDLPGMVMDTLRKSGIQTILFDQLEPEPAPESADNGAALSRDKDIQLVIGVGGGSSMDVAKAVAMLAVNPGKAEDYVGLGLVKEQGLPTVMIPTTAGTGSEVTFTAVFTMREKKSKGGINDEKLFPDLALLDPEITLGCPPEVTAFTGMDALTHAIESYTSLIANPISDLYALEGIRLISENLRTAVYNGSNIDARSKMLLGSHLAGLGLANAGVGAVHALAYPLGALHGINHGTANAVLLPYVMAYNMAGAIQRFANVAQAMGESSDGLAERIAARKAVDAVMDLSEDIGIPQSLAELGIPRESVGEMVEGALKVTRPLANNPRPLGRDNAVRIYRNAF